MKKTIGLLSLLGLVIGLASCSTERQVYSDGRTIEWSRKNTVAVATEDVERPSAPFTYQEVRMSAVEAVRQVEPTLEASTSMVASTVMNKRVGKVLARAQEDVPGAQEGSAPVRMGEAPYSEAVAAPPSSSGGGGKSQLIALILCWLVGVIGIHRFYLGYTWQGIVQLLTLGACGVWTLVDLIRIIMGTLQPKNGPYEKTL